MKKSIFIFLAFLAFAKVNSQILDPVKWTTSIENKSETSYILTFDGVIENEWHLYSQFTPGGGPLPLEIAFKDMKGNYTLVGKAKESKTITSFNDVFGVNETYFEKTVQIKQEIKLLNPKISKIEVTLDYQVCKEVCINLNKKFSFVVPKNNGLAVKQEVSIVAPDSTKADSLAPSLGSSNVLEVNSNLIENKEPESQKGLWSIFIIAFLSGFAALLTPCVFPMIPMTVSFFTKQSKTKALGIRNAIIYGISIILIYVILGLLVTWIFGADALNALSTNI